MRRRLGLMVLSCVLGVGYLLATMVLSGGVDAGAQTSSTTSSSTTLITVGDPALSGGTTAGTTPAELQTAISEMQRRLAAERESGRLAPSAGVTEPPPESGYGLTLALVALAAVLVVVAVVVWPRRRKKDASSAEE